MTFLTPPSRNESASGFVFTSGKPNLTRPGVSKDPKLSNPSFIGPPVRSQLGQSATNWLRLAPPYGAQSKGSSPFDMRKFLGLVFSTQCMAAKSIGAVLLGTIILGRWSINTPLLELPAYLDGAPANYLAPNTPGYALPIVKPLQGDKVIDTRVAWHKTALWSWTYRPFACRLETRNTYISPAGEPFEDRNPQNIHTVDVPANVAEWPHKVQRPAHFVIPGAILLRVTSWEGEWTIVKSTTGACLPWEGIDFRQTKLWWLGDWRIGGMTTGNALRFIAAK